MPTFTVLASLIGPVRVASIFELPVMTHGTLVRTSTYNLLIYDGSRFHEAGLRLEATVNAGDIDAAVDAAERAMERLAPLFALTAASEIPVAQIELAYDSTPGTLKCELIRFSYDGVPESRIRKVYSTTLLPLFADLADLPTKPRVAIERALWWYNLALMQQRSANRFSMLWIALESLKRLLKEHFGDERATTVHCSHFESPLRCAVCSSEQPVRKHPNSGIAHLLEGIPEAIAKGSRRASELRNAIEHGGRTHSDADEEARQLMPMMEAAIPHAVARILGYGAQRETKLVQPVVQPQPARQLTARFTFSRHPDSPLPDSQLGLPGFHPRVELNTRISWAATHSGVRIQGTSIEATIYCNSDVAVGNARGEVRFRQEQWTPTNISLNRSTELPHPPHPDIHGVSLWELTPPGIPVGRPFRSTSEGVITEALSKSSRSIVLGE